MKRVIAIDPGYAKPGKGCACVRIGDGPLLSWFVRSKDLVGSPPPPRCDAVVWEQPQADGRTWHVPPAMIIQLTSEGATVAGYYAARTGAVILVATPSSSKGSVPKPIAHMRMWRVLTDDERAALGGAKTFAAIDQAVERGATRRWPAGYSAYPATYLEHNILDAAALGLQTIGRL